MKFSICFPTNQAERIGAVGVGVLVEYLVGLKQLLTAAIANLPAEEFAIMTVLGMGTPSDSEASTVAVFFDICRNYPAPACNRECGDTVTVSLRQVRRNFVVKEGGRSDPEVLPGNGYPRNMLDLVAGIVHDLGVKEVQGGNKEKNG